MSSEFASTDEYENPRSLLVDLSACSKEGAVDLTRGIYEKEYLTTKVHNGYIGVWCTHDDKHVVFYENTFDHAFFKSANFALDPNDKSVFDLERAARVKWIKRVIACRFKSVRCFQYPAGAKYLRDRRLYVFGEDFYVVWLTQVGTGNSTKFKFETAYRASKEHIRQKVRCCRKINTP